MAKVLTVTALQNLKPGAARREVPDGLMPGLYFVIQPTGKKSWAVRYRIHGQPRKLTIGPCPGIDLKAARELAGRALVKVAGGDDPAAEKREAKVAARTPHDRDLVEKIVPLFVERYAKANQRPASAYETERVLNKEIVSRWKGRHLSEIGKADVHELLDGIMDRGSPVQANRTLAALRRMAGWAVERGIIEVSPVAGIRAPAAETSRDRVLNDAELAAVWKASEDLGWPFGPVVRLLILSGQRRSEIAGMHWQEIDFEKRVFTLPKERAKNGAEHVVPLSSTAIAILKSVPHVASKAGLVFTTNGKSPVDGFGSAKVRLDASLPGETPSWVLHDLRRTFASGCARLGIGLPVVEKLLNHTSGSFRGVTGIYQRFDFASEQRAAVETWARHVQAIVSGETAANVVVELKRGA